MECTGYCRHDANDGFPGDRPIGTRRGGGDLEIIDASVGWWRKTSHRPRRTLGQALDENGGVGPAFNLIRLAAAFAVLTGHSFGLTGRPEWEPFAWFSGG